MALYSTINHRKTQQLANELGVSTAYALGLLEYLWLFTSFNCPSASLKSVSWVRMWSAVEEGAHAGPILVALVNSGFLDTDGDDIVVHDFADHANRNLKKRIGRGSMTIVSIEKEARIKPGDAGWDAFVSAYVDANGIHWNPMDANGRQPSLAKPSLAKPSLAKPGDAGKSAKMPGSRQAPSGSRQPPSAIADPNLPLWEEQESSEGKSTTSRDSTEGKKPKLSRQKKDAFFENEFWPEVWLRKGKHEAKEAFAKLCLTEGHMVALKARAIKQGPYIMADATDNDHAPLRVSTWLNKKRYLDDWENPVKEGDTSW